MSITADTLGNARRFVREVHNFGVDIHTVTLTTNGHTGKVDVKIEGFNLLNEFTPDLSDPFERTFSVS